MISQHVVYYLGSKLAAAVINLAAMALFVRIAGPEIFGGYLLDMAWAVIVYGSTLQWLRFSFFAAFRDDGADVLIATYVRILVVGIGAIFAAAVAATALGLVRADTAAGALALVTGLAAYDTFHETARTRLQARTVAIGVLARAVLILVLGLGALQGFGSALALAAAVGIAHWGAALILLTGVADRLAARPSREAAERLWRFGKPLVPAFALDGIGLQLDRLVLARHAGLGDLGPYGAVSDFIRQIMIVGAEAISGAYFAIARSAAVAGRHDEAGSVLGKAFLAYVALTAFGAAMLLRFDRLLLDMLFGPIVGQAVAPYVAFIVASNVLLIFRAYYFGQALYLMDTSRQLLISNACHAAVTALCALILIPMRGAQGAAIALMLGNLAGCISFMWAWRDHYVVRLPYLDAAVVTAAALLAFLLTGWLMPATGARLPVVALAVAVFAAAAVATAWRYDILSFNEIAGKAWAIAGRRLRRQST